MATVDFRIKNLKAADGTKATLAEVAGSIDATSIVQFQNVMDKLVEKGVRNLILDCANVKYINSTGLGTLLKYVDTFESMDGHIAFTKVPSKVMLVMEMLGFNALFSIVPDEAAALRSFGGKVAAAPAPAPVQIAQPTIQPAPTISRPAPAPVIQQPTIRPPTAVAPVAPMIVPSPGGAPAPAPAGSYPTTAECARCRVSLELASPGKYRCPRCQNVIVAEPGGKVHFYAPKKERPVSVSLPARQELFLSLAPLAEGVARQSGFNGNLVGAIGQAVVAVFQGVAQQAYAGDPSGLIHLLMVPEDGLFTIRVSDYGKPFPPGPDGVPRELEPLKQVMDTVEVKQNARGGNLITMTKRRG